MNNRWFGQQPWGPACRHLERVPAPTGETCLLCDEAIDFDDDGLLCGNGPLHRECLLRSVVGSVGHQQGRCSCYGGDEEDPPGLTKRAAAVAATEYFERRQR